MSERIISTVETQVQVVFDQIKSKYGPGAYNWILTFKGVRLNPGTKPAVFVSVTDRDTGDSWSSTLSITEDINSGVVSGQALFAKIEEYLGQVLEQRKAF